MTSFFRAAVKLTKGIFSIHPFWAAWIQLLIILHMVVAWFFLEQIESVVVLITFGLSAVTMTWMTHQFGFTRILGAAHFWWIPMLIYLALRVGRHPADDLFGWWLRILLVVDVITLLLDINDVRRWLQGERAEIVAGL